MSTYHPQVLAYGRCRVRPRSSVWSAAGRVVRAFAGPRRCRRRTALASQVECGEARQAGRGLADCEQFTRAAAEAGDNPDHVLPHRCSPLTRYPVPRRRWSHDVTFGLRVADQRRVVADLRLPAGRHLVLPRPRRRLDSGRAAASSLRMALPRLVGVVSSAWRVRARQALVGGHLEHRASHRPDNRSRIAQIVSPAGEPAVATASP
jgi:hypothetical protein